MAAALLIAATPVLPGDASAAELLPQLSAEIHLRGETSGWFTQCTEQKNTRIGSAGRFTFTPGRQIELNFERPAVYTLIFFSDGTQVKNSGGTEQKTPRYSRIARLIFSVISMQKTVLEKHFNLAITGAMDKFSMALTPKKRMSKIIQSAKILGLDGLVNEFQMTTRDNRAISIRFLSAAPVAAACD